MRNPFEIKTNFSQGGKQNLLDWDESASDLARQTEAVHDADRVAPSMKSLSVVAVLLFLVLGARIFYLQIVHGSSFRALSESNRIRSQTLLAPRGLILDSRGKILARNTASFNLVVTPVDLPKNPDQLNLELSEASSTFSFDAAELKNKLALAGKNSLQPIVVKQNLDQDQEILFQTKASQFIGFSIQSIPIRDYLDPQVFSHVLGYTSLVSQDDQTKLDSDKYASVDYVGRVGVEAEYESYLHGINGQNLIEVDASGKLQDVLGQNDPVPGDTLQLNIDQELQKKIYDDLSAGKNPKAAAVALNPKTGQILALVSLPGFNNNLFAQGIKSSEYQSLLNDKNLPLFNRATAGTYPPGSTVKPMVGLAALQEKIITPATIINDRGVLVIPNQYDPSLKYNFYGWNHSGLGPMNIYSAIAESSDIYFYTVAGGYPNSAVPDGLGAEKLAEYYRKFNLGSTTKIDIPGEKPGLVPDPEWKAGYFKNDPILSKWYLGDTYHIGIGQGDLLVTPLQVAEWTSIIANNGTGMMPQVLKQVFDSQGQILLKQTPKVLVSKFLDDTNIKIIQQAMRQTVVSGSGRQLAGLPILAAGKTGTSQFDGSDPKRTHAWFTAYAPFDDPQIVITVLVEAGGEGHIAAVPVVKDALLWWANNRMGQ